LFWYTSGTSGYVEWELTHVKADPGHIFDGSSSDTTLTSVVAVQGVANTAVVTEFEIDVTDYLITDTIGIKILRDATAGNGDDTLVGSVILAGISASATFWRD
jgi:hypothetical protein